MANTAFFFSFSSLFLLVCSSMSGANVVFQPSFLSAHGPIVTVLLHGNTSNITLNLQTVSPSNVTGSFDPPSCVPGTTQWILSSEHVAKTTLQILLRLNRSLRLCGNNDTETDCCKKPLCVLETLQLSACVANAPQASLLIQVKIYALLVSASAGLVPPLACTTNHTLLNTTLTKQSRFTLVPALVSADDLLYIIEQYNKTIIQNQVYRPLGTCPCDLTLNTCDVWCCCDEDCLAEDVQLFRNHCLLGPFGGQVPDPEYQCSVQSSQNSPDWFPFLCVTSPTENNPYLGLFYQGNTIVPKPGVSFGGSVLSSPALFSSYIEESPILTLDEQYFTIPQILNGHCVPNAPVAFLKNFDARCVTLLNLNSCPTEPPLQAILTDLQTGVKNGDGGDIVVDVTDNVATDLSDFISSSESLGSSGLVCENITLSLDYTFYWKGNGITQITLTRTVGTVTLNGSVSVTTRYSAVFLSGDTMTEPNSGNPGYQVGKPVIGGFNANSTASDADSIQRTSINLWKPVNNGHCTSANVKPVVFGENSTSGCLLSIVQQNLTQCSSLRDTVASLQESLVKATFVARNGRPNALSLVDWLNIKYVPLNASGPTEDTNSSCTVPAHMQIHVWSLITGFVDGIPQKEIKAMQISYSMSTWRQECGGGDPSVCMDPAKTQLFPVTSSVTFIDIPFNMRPPTNRYRINFTEYDCNRNDVCWPELAFPITRFYTGEPYSQALAKGLILVFFFIVASVLGTPWRQIRQIWNSF